MFNMFTPPKKIKIKTNLIEFRAGKMRLAENNMVYADERRGLAYIHRTKDGMVHFCWKERTSNRVEDDLIVFPQETIFKRITQCTTGRVYLLKFKDAKKLFLWMQEPKEEKDADICRTVNEVLNQGRVELVQNAQKDINMVEFTNLLGQLNDIGALNEIDLMEILGMTHEFDSRGTSESGASNIYGMNPFQIGSNYSIATFAERSGNTGIINDNSLPIKESSIPLKQSTRIDISSINSQSTARLDPNEIFSETTLINLSRNKAFKSKVLCIENGQNGHEVDITSDEFKTRISNFGEILMNPVIARELLNEMGVPDRIIVKLQNNDLGPLINDLEEYFGKKNTDER